MTSRSAACWRQRLRACMEERGLTQVEFVGALNRQYLTRFHQKDVSRWLNTGNRTTNGTIGFPKYETMAVIADFFGVDVGYLTGETDERSFDLAKACDYIGLGAAAVEAIRSWTAVDGAMAAYRADTLNRMFSSAHFPTVADKMMTLNEMSTMWRQDPQQFSRLMASLASSEEYPRDLTLRLLVGAFYGMANESFSTLLRDAYPTPDEEVVDGERE
ncbi:helix-turn-helix domain-containing protein [Bifidobacterium cuniculi]|nr:helix-turn-helix transcriptional regulator [Bifidobacterium cuniculi]